MLTPGQPPAGRETINGWTQGVVRGEFGPATTTHRPRDHQRLDPGFRQEPGELRASLNTMTAAVSGHASRNSTDSRTSGGTAARSVGSKP